MRNVVKLDNYYSPEELEHAITGFIDYYNNQHFHESLDNLKPADVFHGRAWKILKERALIKKKTMQSRRKNYHQEKHIEANFV